jgi:hypothetical protein
MAQPARSLPRIRLQSLVKHPEKETHPIHKRGYPNQRTYRPSQVHEKQNETDEMLKATWTVTAGIIPDQPIDEHSRSWSYDSADYEKDGEVPIIFQQIKEEVYEYMMEITDPCILNWVDVKFVWY